MRMECTSFLFGTFRYDGIWLEEMSAAGLGSLTPSGTNGVVGAVIPVTAQDCLLDAGNAGLSHAGDYRFWSRRLT